MASKIDARDFLINTDYEMDKVIFLYDGVIQIDGDAIVLGDGTRREIKTITTGLPFCPLMFGFCSYNKDFKDSHTFPYYEGYRAVGGIPISISTDISFYVDGNDNNLEVTYDASPRVTDPKPIYYRIYGFEPTTSNAKIGKTSNRAKTFTINSSQDYRKLYKKGVVRAGETEVIKHDLGYIPQIELWSSFTWPYGEHEVYTYRIAQAEENVLTTTKTTATISCPSGWWDVVHYRIYYDEA